MHHFDYPVVDREGSSTGKSVQVATTRIETMIGDAAVAIHPGDQRFKVCMRMFFAG